MRPAAVRCWTRRGQYGKRHGVVAFHFVMRAAWDRSAGRVAPRPQGKSRPWWSATRDRSAGQCPALPVGEIRGDVNAAADGGPRGRAELGTGDVQIAGDQELVGFHGRGVVEPHNEAGTGESRAAIHALAAKMPDLNLPERQRKLNA